MPRVRGPGPPPSARVPKGRAPAPPNSGQRAGRLQGLPGRPELRLRPSHAPPPPPAPASARAQDDGDPTACRGPPQAADGELRKKRFRERRLSKDISHILNSMDEGGGAEGAGGAGGAGAAAAEGGAAEEAGSPWPRQASPMKVRFAAADAAAAGAAAPEAPPPVSAPDSARGEGGNFAAAAELGEAELVQVRDAVSLSRDMDQVASRASEPALTPARRLLHALAARTHAPLRCRLGLLTAARAVSGSDAGAPGG